MGKIEVSAAPEVSTRLWTPANIVTLIRICLVPVFVVVLLSPWPEFLHLPAIATESKSLIAACIFILISCTDWLDGYLARSRGEVTDFGKFMDPLADKILVVAALLALIELGALPSWVALIIVSREFIVSGVRMVSASKGVVIAASWYGKFKTVFQMIAIVLFTIKDSHMVGSIAEAMGDILWVVSWLVMTIALVLTVVSMLDYIAKARELIGLGKPSRRSSKMGGEKDASLNAEAATQVADSVALETGCAPQRDEGIDPHSRPAAPFDDDVILKAAQLLDAARGKGLTLGTAESLTGGLICSALTSVPGSSSVVCGGIASYMASVKEGVLGVDSAAIAGEGVVSEAVAAQMAGGARLALGCDICVAVTGIAGPGGAEEGKPVGTVCFACAIENECVTKTVVFDGGRDDVRNQTVTVALDMLIAAVSLS